MILRRAEYLRAGDLIRMRWDAPEERWFTVIRAERGGEGMIGLEISRQDISGVWTALVLLPVDLVEVQPRGMAPEEFKAWALARRERGT